MVDNEDADFIGYVDSIKRKEGVEKSEALAAKQRKIWRETTWAGMLISSVEKIGAAPFFVAIGNSFEEGESSTSFYLVSLLYKIGIITSGILSVYLIGMIMKMISGEEIVIEQEVVIVEEVTRSQVEAEERAARGKLKKR
mmetsp:Transcript_14422/g.26049  ORF Transcript_14422/g.26049 Transcript_14422/m.26049 type:complete len:140 (-) Transcript_14422:131-550(-)|eukprot:CAMPEP_0201610334 /NCGR_PEP_ID=MMETSP0492-20130828/16601_1 /ASSEMBLY_ACC=CAM_ASM_000837 /TAXON_ID=420259 /ORGANISM="Thalassiosira gravida, Strain GMp14c1" /LENGTH=139 /DNA_ID=CAMNT_0048076129 /DNA_START=79 /DNA_END=498 /DNA_ORIENTATION=-